MYPNVSNDKYLKVILIFRSPQYRALGKLLANCTIEALPTGVLVTYCDDKQQFFCQYTVVP